MKTPEIRLSNVNSLIETVTGHRIVARDEFGEEVDVSLHIEQSPRALRMPNPVRIHFPFKRG